SLRRHRCRFSLPPGIQRDLFHDLSPSCPCSSYPISILDLSGRLGGQLLFFPRWPSIHRLPWSDPSPFGFRIFSRQRSAPFLKLFSPNPLPSFRLWRPCS